MVVLGGSTIAFCAELLFKELRRPNGNINVLPIVEIALEKEILHNIMDARWCGICGRNQKSLNTALSRRMTETQDFHKCDDAAQRAQTHSRRL